MKDNATDNPTYETHLNKYIKTNIAVVSALFSHRGAVLVQGRANTAAAVEDALHQKKPSVANK